MSVTPRYTHASQLRDENEAYCSRDLVLQLLAGISKGTDEEALTQLGDTDARDAFIDLWLPVATEKVSSVTKQDYGCHEDVTLYVSGNNRNALDLKDLGIPYGKIVSVSALTIDDEAVDEAVYYVTHDGWLVYSDVSGYNPNFPRRQASSKLFAPGNLNVAITLTWGDQTPPANVQMACGLFCCAYVVPFAEAFDTNKDDDIPGGNVTLRMGDMQVTQYAGSGRYATFVKHCYKTAMDLCTTRGGRVRATMVEPENF